MNSSTDSVSLLRKEYSVGELVVTEITVRVVHRPGIDFEQIQHVESIEQLVPDIFGGI